MNGFKKVDIKESLKNKVDENIISEIPRKMDEVLPVIEKTSLRKSNR